LLIRSFIIGIILLLPWQAGKQPSRSDGAPFETSRALDSAAASLRRSYAGLSSPELVHRTALRREVQQRGYVSVFHDLLAGDGIGALISFLRLNAQLDFHLPHNTLVVYARVKQPELQTWEKRLPGTTGAPGPPVAIPLYEDLSFPIDPWSKPK
jgi:hypothetical protein